MIAGRIGPFEVIMWLFVVAIVYSLVRPGSKAGTALVSITDVLVAVIGETTGYTAKQAAAKKKG